jgi:phosphomannomutase
MFLDYDLRGLYPKELSPQLVKSVVFQFYQKSKNLSREAFLAIDTRESSLKIAHYIKSLLPNYFKYIGILPTPIFYCLVISKNIPGIMITASHLPKKYNGLKFLFPGGITFGPRKEEKKQIKITKKMRRKAILMTVAEKFRKNLLKCFENFPLEGKTKEMAKFLTKFLEPRKTKKKYETCLLVIPENDKKIFQAVRNLPYADAIEARNLNLLSLLNHKYLFLTPESLSVIEKTFKK